MYGMAISFGPRAAIVHVQAASGFIREISAPRFLRIRFQINDQTTNTNSEPNSWILQRYNRCEARFSRRRRRPRGNTFNISPAEPGWVWWLNSETVLVWAFAPLLTEGVGLGRVVCFKSNDAFVAAAEGECYPYDASPPAAGILIV